MAAEVGARSRKRRGSSHYCCWGAGRVRQGSLSFNPYIPADAGLRVLPMPKGLSLLYAIRRLGCILKRAKGACLDWHSYILIGTLPLARQK